MNKILTIRFFLETIFGNFSFFHFANWAVLKSETVNLLYSVAKTPAPLFFKKLTVEIKKKIFRLNYCFLKLLHFWVSNYVGIRRLWAPLVQIEFSFLPTYCTKMVRRACFCDFKVNMLTSKITSWNLTEKFELYFSRKILTPTPYFWSKNRIFGVRILGDEFLWRRIFGRRIFRRRIFGRRIFRRRILGDEFLGDEF